MMLSGENERPADRRGSIAAGIWRGLCALSAFSSTFGRSPASTGVFFSLSRRRRRCRQLPRAMSVYVDPDNRGWALCVSESERYT
jgi:hypothetical protein